MSLDIQYKIKRETFPDKKIELEKNITKL